jgi:hypothetical protein
MDLTVLKKRISTYRTPKGKITSLPDELLAEILHAWEQWTGPVSEFYRLLEVDYRKMSSLMGRAKKLKREGAFDTLFTEVKVIEHDIQTASVVTGAVGIEILWQNKYPIRFARVHDLINFLDLLENKKTQSPSNLEITPEAA